MQQQEETLAQEGVIHCPQVPEYQADLQRYCHISWRVVHRLCFLGLCMLFLRLLLLLLHGRVTVQAAPQLFNALLCYALLWNNSQAD